jgi:hypothetical protein
MDFLVPESEFLPSFAFFVLSWLSMDYMMLTHIGEGELSLLNPLIQMLIFFRYTLTDITRNNVLPTLWYPLTQSSWHLKWTIMPPYTWRKETSLSLKAKIHKKESEKNRPAKFPPVCYHWIISFSPSIIPLHVHSLLHQTWHKNTRSFSYECSCVT